MGLDFGLYSRKKNKYHDDDWRKNELCYGRKSWELVYTLNLPIDSPDGEAQVKLEDWIDLIEKMVPIGDYLDEIWNAYHKYDNLSEDFPEEVMTPREKKLIATYESWHNQTFDEHPQLGYEFSVGYMKSFWDAKDEAVKYLEDPDYEVWAYISY